MVPIISMNNFQIVAEAKFNPFDNGTIMFGNSQIFYGLFNGKLTRNLIQTPILYDLSSEINFLTHEYLLIN